MNFHLSRSVLLVTIVLVLIGCAPQRSLPPAPVSLPTPVPAAPYAPIDLARDEAPHDMLTEWWYYTGHLRATDGRQYGFELVIFQTVRGDYPVYYLGQFAVTDRQRQTFQHASKLAQGSQIGRQDGFDLAVQDWRMQGAGGRDHLQAGLDGYNLEVDLTSQKPAALHDQDGIVSFGPAGDSYYYSYTRQTLRGTLVDHGEQVPVEGQAWFDHQWGNFLVLGGGWDWFCLQLDDQAELMLNHLRDDQNRIVNVWGTYVAPDGSYRPLTSADFNIEPTGRWTSPHSGANYPMGWQIKHRDPAYNLRLTPVLTDQELVSQGNGPTYWEGAVEIDGSRGGASVRGLGYAEMTGYAR
jgi:predicted secreted hydrolase